MIPHVIWIDDKVREDCYVEFFTEFLSEEKDIFIDIGADTDYELYLNNKFINCGAYPCYPGKMVLDTLSCRAKEGKNSLKIIVYYNGSDTFATYYKKDPGLYFKVYSQGKTLCVSDENVLSRYDVNYQSFKQKRITCQLGYKVFYNFASNGGAFKKSKVQNNHIQFENRPNKKCVFLDTREGTLVKDIKEKTYDLGKETTGFLTFSINSSKEKDIRIFFGEHVKEGKILGEIDGRDFSFAVHLKEGENSAALYLRRIGCRYLSIDDSEGIEVNSIGIIPSQYPFAEKEIKANNENDKKLIDTAIYTLKCCYHDHFEDCPWREQAEYTFDTKCALLGFYQAFDNMEAVKSSLQLMIADPRDDGDLDMTFPSKFHLVIPSFSLHFIPLIYDYYINSNDITLVKSSLEKIALILEGYSKKIHGVLLSVKKDEAHWIFYEWKEGFDGNGAIVPEKDFLLNAMFLYSLQIAKKLYAACGVFFVFDELEEKLRNAINDNFYDEKKKTFIFAKENPITSELMLAYAILTGLKPEMNKEFARQIVNKEIRESTNSFKSVVYEALLNVDEAYMEYILNEIRTIYHGMLEDGATTFYETNKGYLDFDKAGSLCHGWNGFIIKYLLQHQSQ